MSQTKYESIKISLLDRKELVQCVFKGKYWAVTKNYLFPRRVSVTHIGTGMKISNEYSRPKSIALAGKLDKWLPFSTKRDVRRAAKKLTKEQRELIGAPNP